MQSQNKYSSSFSLPKVSQVILNHSKQEIEASWVISLVWKTSHRCEVYTDSAHTAQNSSGWL